MKRLVNFSHGLSEKAKIALENIIGESVEETVIPCQLNMEAALRPQLEALLAAHERTLVRMDLYIPPALSFAAGYVTAKLSYAQSDAVPPSPPAMVVMRREGTPPQFVPVEILRG